MDMNENKVTSNICTTLCYEHAFILFAMLLMQFS